MRNNGKKNKQDKFKGNRQFMCRICRHPHALRKCRRFLGLNITQRRDIVKKYGYCENCLAHSHSDGACFTKTGCRICHKNHHTLLHAHPRIQARKPLPDTPTTKPSTSKMACDTQAKGTSQSSTSTNETSLTSILKQDAITLLPTIIAKVDTKNGRSIVRCLLDSGARTSCISSKTVDKLNLMTLALDEETICPITLLSIHDENVSIKTVLKMTNRVTISTPSNSISKSIRQKFHNFILADVEFFKPAPIDIIFGVDIYAKILSEGILCRSGLPTAQNTIFGWSIYGLCSK
ncbi:uncharacterized protein LOC131997831 [Stomoxys calcitrans]|uniref:uncharacterized protein LOC131994149 n=1 Tax=Stomoxys calcitrans TaxID=35570 RepID=UPI0027E25C9F|nr:uncharacterized protein LOC131994149 [Stomoxys calcitrans]XP_059217652.1 uncharacterized protein LOC131994786 [Stomoxys calcitrans]XP_059223739.1 uncharacterized protein LOC131997205 [Stomoxys calcitrans]XP_059225561.1 uncharacterized protein LOC131997831 [Stomoxys calcitrans]